MKKTIKKGELAGLTEITEAMMERKAEDAIADMGIPTYTVPVVTTKPIQQNCKAGDIDACQNASWCGQCVDASRKDTNPAKKIVTGFQDILDVPRYVEMAGLN